MTNPTLETLAVYLADLEVRQEGGRPEIRGNFRYDGVATIANTGRRRKERFAPGAFSYSIERPDFEINLLSGHEFSKNLATKRAGSLSFSDGPDALDFTASLPIDSEQPTYMRDTVLAIRAGLVGGISPGFNVPPRAAVPDAESEEPEPGNPGIFIRVLRTVLVPEFSLVTRAAYSDSTSVEMRAESTEPPTLDPRTALWLYR